MGSVVDTVPHQGIWHCFILHSWDTSETVPQCPELQTSSTNSDQSNGAQSLLSYGPINNGLVNWPGGFFLLIVLYVNPQRIKDVLKTKERMARWQTSYSLRGEIVPTGHLGPAGHMPTLPVPSDALTGVRSQWKGCGTYNRAHGNILPGSWGQRSSVDRGREEVLLWARTVYPLGSFSWICHVTQVPRKSLM